MHSLIVGAPGAGKSTLLRRLLAGSDIPVFGFLTRKERDEWDPLLGHPIYIYPAGGPYIRSRENLIGHCKEQHPIVYGEAFDRFAPRLWEPVPQGAVILMDEIGFMEASSEAFCRGILHLLDGDIPVLAAVKQKNTPFLQTVRNHPKATCYHLTQENRETLFHQLLQIL